MTPKNPTTTLIEAQVDQMFDRSNETPEKAKQRRTVSAILSSRLRRRPAHDTALTANGKIISRRVTERTRTKVEDAPKPLVERTISNRVDNRNLPLNMHTIGAHGNAGSGYLGKIGRCGACGRENKLVGPLSAAPERRTCQPSCEAQKGPHPIKDKARNWRSSRSAEV